MESPSVTLRSIPRVDVLFDGCMKGFWRWCKTGGRGGPGDYEVGSPGVSDRSRACWHIQGKQMAVVRNASAHWQCSVWWYGEKVFSDIR